MGELSRPENSTGYTPSTGTARVIGSAPVDTIPEKNAASPVFPAAPTAAASLISTGEVLPSELLAVMVMMGDFPALKAELPASRQSSSNGKIYWCAEWPGHLLAISPDGHLLVDGKSAADLLNNLPEA